jgi:hypothetical protein
MISVSFFQPFAGNVVENVKHVELAKHAAALPESRFAEVGLAQLSNLSSSRKRRNQDNFSLRLHSE